MTFLARVLLFLTITLVPFMCGNNADNEISLLIGADSCAISLSL